MDEPKFSLDDFKHWMKNQNEYVYKMSKSNVLIGIMVESKFASMRLKNKIFPEDGDLCELAKDFKDGGGKIIHVDGKSFLIEVNSGTFYIPRQYVRKI
jgi:hypothetical protein